MRSTSLLFLAALTICLVTSYAFPFVDRPKRHSDIELAIRERHLANARNQRERLQKELYGFGVVDPFSQGRKRRSMDSFLLEKLIERIEERELDDGRLRPFRKLGYLYSGGPDV